MYQELGRPKAFKLNLLGREMFFLVDIKAVNSGPRSRGDDFADLVFFGGGITCMAPGDRHTAIRKLFHPFVNTTKYVQQVEPTLQKHCAILIDKIRQHAKAGTFFDLQVMLNYISMDLSTDIVFGFNPNTINEGAGNNFWTDWTIQNEFTMNAVTHAAVVESDQNTVGAQLGE